MNTNLRDRANRLVGPPLVVLAAVAGFMFEFVVELPFRLVLAWSGQEQKKDPSAYVSAPCDGEDS